jgi:hypothetical protein
LKSKLYILVILSILFFCSATFAQAQTNPTQWRDDFSYTTQQQMQATGWTFGRPAGTTLETGTVILNGVGGDTSITYPGPLPTGLYDWRAEANVMWLGQGHSGLNIFIITEKHSYGFSADGWYSNFVLYRDNIKLLTFGTYQEQNSQWVSLTMQKTANTIYMYFNGLLQNTYTETDATPSMVTAVTLVSPWQGDSKYDYIQLTQNTPYASPTPTNKTSTAEAWVPAPTNAGIATAVTVGSVGAVSLIATAITSSPVASTGNALNKLGEKLSDLVPDTTKKWLENFISSRRKLKIGEKTGSTYLPTKPEAKAYCISLIVLALSFSYVKASSIDQIIAVLPTILATSIIVGFAKTYILEAYARSRGVWTEQRLWYLGLAMFVLTTVAFRVPFSSPSRSVHYTPKYTKNLVGTVSYASVLLTLGFAAIFFVITQSGFTLIGSTGLAMCIIGAFFDTFPIEPMNGKSIYKHSKALWAILFGITLTLYIIWLLNLQ